MWTFQNTAVISPFVPVRRSSNRKGADLRMLERNGVHRVVYYSEVMRFTTIKAQLVSTAYSLRVAMALFTPSTRKVIARWLRIREGMKVQGEGKYKAAEY